MHVRAIDAVRPARHQISQIDDEGPVDRRGRDPFIGGVLNFKAADTVLCEKGDAALVGMGTGAELVELCCFGLRGIAHQAQDGTRPVVMLRKP